MSRNRGPRLREMSATDGSLPVKSQIFGPLFVDSKKKIFFLVKYSRHSPQLLHKSSHLICPQWPLNTQINKHFNITDYTWLNSEKPTRLIQWFTLEITFKFSNPHRNLIESSNCMVQRLMIKNFEYNSISISRTMGRLNNFLGYFFKYRQKH